MTAKFSSATSLRSLDYTSILIPKGNIDIKKIIIQFNVQHVNMPKIKQMF